VKCIPAKEDTHKCSACLRRGAECIKTGSRSAKRGIPSADDITSRIEQLELVMQSSMTTNQKDIVSIDIDYACTQPGPINELNISRFSRRRQSVATSPQRISPVPFEEKDEEAVESLSLAQSRDSPGRSLTRTSTTLGPAISFTGSLKHAKACKILLTALRNSSNFQDALKAHNIFWKMDNRRADPTASYPDADIMEYARRALNGNNPIDIARLGQIVATEAPNLKLTEDLALLVDKLIISDDEYLCTLEGLECAFHQGRIWLEVGQMNQAW
jgi:hypothetical protein